MDPELAFGLSVRGRMRRHPSPSTVYAASLSWVDRRGGDDLWRVGAGHENSTRWSASLDVRDLKIRTYTLQESLAAVVRIPGIRRPGLAVVPLRGAATDRERPGIVDADPGGTAAVLLQPAPAYRLGKAMLVEYRPDAILRDTGHGLLFALQDAGLMGKGVQPEPFGVAEKSDGYEVSLEDASAEDAAVFIRSYRQIFAPVRDQRYLILTQRTPPPESRLELHLVLFRPFFRRFEDYPPAYHPVPDVLATRKENAEAFSRYPWQRYVGGRDLRLHPHRRRPQDATWCPRSETSPNQRPGIRSLEVDDLFYTSHATIIQAMTSVRASQSERLARIWRSLVR